MTFVEEIEFTTNGNRLEGAYYCARGLYGTGFVNITHVKFNGRRPSEDFQGVPANKGHVDCYVATVEVCL